MAGEFGNQDFNPSDSSGGTSGSGSDGPQPYQGGLYTDSNPGHINPGQPTPAMPRIPASADGGAPLSVDTSALKTFSDNLDTIADALGGARKKLDQLQPVRAGGKEFVEAQNLARKVSGSHGDGGLQHNYVASLTALRTALMDTAEGIRTLANKYSSIEEINQKAGADLHQLLQQAQGDIGKLQQTAGGSGSHSGSSSGSNSGSNSGSSSGSNSGSSSGSTA
ncbi:hypothetical protein [Streptantibioticus ferralitis]|uniref:Uncharacterized protein n=1 Tax=Streptantibioticus ferralitis TaxID=236510 RepID=A0ABT5Z4X6_9ACTN|nr:hypothetical protein [Streptantibioticus ferralitis]MDF2258774.1 hypothetical protein [Streptantibioticus ferralitis]